MSMPLTETIACPSCGQKHPFVIWRTLNVTLNPQEKKQLLAGELLRFTCPSCGSAAPVIYPMLYHDMAGKLMIWLVPGGAEEQALASEVSKVPPDALAAMLAEGYRFRMVDEPNALLEKVLVFDRELDDLAVEVVKLVIEAQLPPEGRGSRVLFTDLAVDPSGQEVLAFTLLSPAGATGAGVPVEVYRQVARDFAAPMPPPAPGEWARIGRAEAMAAVEAQARRQRGEGPSTDTV